MRGQTYTKHTWVCSVVALNASREQSDLSISTLGSEYALHL